MVGWMDDGTVSHGEPELLEDLVVVVRGMDRMGRDLAE